MRVTLVIYSMGAGGAERIMSRMANYWSEKGWKMTLLAFEDRSKPSFYELHPAVDYRPLGIASKSKNAASAIRNNLQRLSALRAAIEASSPDVVISSMSETNVLVLLATIGLAVPVIVREAIDPSQHRIGKAWHCLRLLTYQRASAVVALTKESMSYFPACIRKRGRIIPNPAVVNGDHHVKKSRFGKVLMAMGRLDKQKGFDLLLRAFAKIAMRHPDWSLEIWGQGALKEELNSLIVQLGLLNRVRLAGVTQHAFDQLRQADLFVLPSRYEGFPGVLCEAMGCGLPVVSFDCPSGPRDIIRDGIDGQLVPPENVDILADTLDRLMADETERERLAQRAPDVLERFGLSRIMAMWEELICECSAQCVDLKPPGEQFVRQN